jgi:hypothetical protein
MNIKDWLQFIIDIFKIITWPAVVIFGICLFSDQIKSIMKRLIKAELPGGISIEAIPDELKKGELAKTLIENEPKKEEHKYDVIPLNAVNNRMIEVGLRPSPSGLDISYYNDLIEQDSRIALSALRIDLEIILNNLAKGFKIPIDRTLSANVTARLLLNSSAITKNQYELINSIVNVCNFAIHGGNINKEQARQVLALAPVLINDYIAWLGWGFK